MSFNPIGQLVAPTFFSVFSVFFSTMQNLKRFFLVKMSIKLVFVI